MYSRDFGGIRSDGQLREFQDDLQNRYDKKDSARADGVIAEKDSERDKNASGGLLESVKSSFAGFDFLKNIKLEDLILIGIGLLILFGNEDHNIITLILIALLVIL